MYSDRAAALIRAQESSTLPVARFNDTYATELLDLYKGTLDGADEYRPFLVAARLLEQDANTQRLTETRGTKFDNLQRTVDSLYDLQAQIDLGLGTEIPEGMEARKLDCADCSPGDGVGSSSARPPSQFRVSYGV